MSGGFHYYYDIKEDKFYNTLDDHLMEEMITRELLKFCQGYLDL